MKQIVPAQSIDKNSVRFPVTGERCRQYAMIVSMELFGCSLAQVSDETGLSSEEVNAICDSEDYAYIKQTLINNIRKLDQATLTGKIVSAASEAFDRMVELSKASDGKKDIVKFEANKDILDRALIANTAAQEADELRITLIKRR